MRPLRLIVIAVLSLAGAIATLLLYSHLLRRRAETLLRNSYELSNQAGNTVTVGVLQQRFGSQLKQLYGCAASQSECGYEVVVSNRLLAATHLARYAEMKSQFDLRDGVVIQNMVDYSTNVPDGSSIVTHVQIDFCKTCDSFSLHPWEASPTTTNGLVEIGSASSIEKKHHVLSLDVRCMTKRGGCSTVAELLPTVWQYRDGRIICRIPNHEGFVDYPSEWLRNDLKVR